MPEIGRTLQEARMRAKIDISEVESGTKIRAKYLRAIENEEWGLLPGPTFVKSFLRTYAEYLGLDAKLLVEEYKLHHEEPSEAELAQQVAPPPRARPRVPLAAPRVSRGWAIGAGVVGVIALLILIGSLGNDDSGTPEAPTTSSTARTTTARTPAPAPRPTVARLELIPDGVVYVCLRDAKDKQLLNQSLQPGGDAQLKFRSKRFRLTVGNFRIRMKINGREFKVEPSPSAVNYEITPRGRKTLPTGQGAC
jgi:hypothetical protein